MVSKKWTAAAFGAAFVVAAPMAVAGASTSTGPNTVTGPYILPVADGVDITSILTVNDSGAANNGYEYVGIPDGLGAYRDKKKIVVFSNHELRPEQGIVRRHGQQGAFVSRLVIDRKTHAVESGTDLINPGTLFWDYPSASLVTGGMRFVDGAAQDPRFGRFCSGYLTTPGQLYNKSTKRGYKGDIYFANEENGDNARAFGVTADGDATMLPRLGLFSWENTVAASNRSDTTLVMGNEDTAAGQLWAYVGTKQKTGAPVDLAGLTNGVNHVFDAVNAAVTTDAEFRAAYPKGTPADVVLNEVDWNQTGAAQNAEALADGLTLNRIEDGAFDPKHRNDYYFVTTEGGDTTPAVTGTRDGGGLWRLSFRNIDKPQLGATLTLLLDGSEEIGQNESRINKPDNVTIDRHGNLLIQEDPGGNDHLARILAYRIDDGALAVVARSNADLFGTGATADPARLTTDEESSGIIDTEGLLGDGTFLFDAQVHTPKNLGLNTTEYVENGQLLKLEVDDWDDVYGNGDHEDDDD